MSIHFKKFEGYYINIREAGYTDTSRTPFIITIIDNDVELAILSDIHFSMYINDEPLTFEITASKDPSVFANWKVIDTIPYSSNRLQFTKTKYNDKILISCPRLHYTYNELKNLLQQI